MGPCSATAGLIAARAGVPVQTLVIEMSTPYLGKHWPLFRPPSLPLAVRVRYEFFGDCAFERIGVGGGGLHICLQDYRAVGVSDQSAQGEQAVFFGAIRGKRHLAASAQRAGEGAFGGHAGVCDIVV